MEHAPRLTYRSAQTLYFRKGDVDSASAFFHGFPRLREHSLVAFAILHADNTSESMRQRNVFSSTCH